MDSGGGFQTHSLSPDTKLTGGLEENENEQKNECKVINK